MFSYVTAPFSPGPDHVGRSADLGRDSKNQEALGKILPDYTVNFLRPPYGEQNETVCQSSPLPLILWDVDSGDWDNPQAEGIYAAVMENIQDGDIVVFHDDNPQTVKALKQMLPALKAWGYQFATVSNLLRLHNTNDWERIKPKG